LSASSSAVSLNGLNSHFNDFPLLTGFYQRFLFALGGAPCNHDRMPVILDHDSYDLWLDPGMNDGGTASELLKPYDHRLMRCYPVSTRINHVVNDDEECSRPVEVAETLFS